jgi:hypothetical protein
MSGNFWYFFAALELRHGRSSATLEYYHSVEPKPLRDARTEIIAMDLGKLFHFISLLNFN